jgi:hypothetical protein
VHHHILPATDALFSVLDLPVPQRLVLCSAISFVVVDDGVVVATAAVSSDCLLFLRLAMLLLLQHVQDKND